MLLEALRDKQIRLALTLLYGLAALCLMLAHGQSALAGTSETSSLLCLGGTDEQASDRFECGFCSIGKALGIAPSSEALLAVSDNGRGQGWLFPASTFHPSEGTGPFSARGPPASF